MDPFVAITCLLTGSLLTLAFLGLLVRRGVRQLAVASAYREVAQHLGLQVDTRGVSIRGHLGERRIWIGEVMETHGTERRIQVRGLLSFERPLGLGLNVRRRGRRLLRRGRRPAELLLNDPELDRQLHIEADDPARARPLFTHEVVQAVRALLERWPDAMVTDDEVQIWLRQPEESSAGLQSLVSTLVRTSEAIETARRDVAPPATLEAFIEPWREMARSLGLEFEPWLPAARGTIEGHRVLLTARREAEGYAVTLQLWFNPHPELGLVLRPQIEPDGYWSVGQDIQVGDRRFDEAFVVKGYDPWAVSARLSATARERLLELRDIGAIVVDDRGLQLRGLPLDTGPLAYALRGAAAAARAIGW